MTGSGWRTTGGDGARALRSCSCRTAGRGTGPITVRSFRWSRPPPTSSFPTRAELIDGKPDAVRAYLRHFWSHWSGPGYEPAAEWRLLDFAHDPSLRELLGVTSMQARLESRGWDNQGNGSTMAALVKRGLVVHGERRPRSPACGTTCCGSS